MDAPSRQRTRDEFLGDGAVTGRAERTGVSADPIGQDALPFATDSEAAPVSLDLVPPPRTSADGSTAVRVHDRERDLSARLRDRSGEELRVVGDVRRKLECRELRVGRFKVELRLLGCHFGCHSGNGRPGGRHGRNTWTRADHPPAATVASPSVAQERTHPVLSREARRLGEMDGPVGEQGATDRELPGFVVR